ncbi:hypothetical protein BG006_004909 [Podila minutissima]|uniref:Uncharacterized protein n=1 Tax=Podila minutissima TaxID=64525 RepID=A0A9P5SQ55_9FUNG|nr:hypothetical protein BG006_004909 [Podila minutissima]
MTNMNVVAQSGIPQHVHFSNHPGYNLLRPEEFFEKYGDYVLRVLRMVKLGYFNNVCDIPSIHTLSILWKYTHTTSTLNKRTVRRLVDKAIAYIKQTSPRKWIMEPGLSRSQSAGIKAYFQGYVSYTRNIFADKVVPDMDTGLQLITVLNYPVPGEQCIHIGNFSIQSRLLPSYLTRSWVELRADLEKFGNMVSMSEEPSECSTTAQELRFMQEKYGLTNTTSITMHNEKKLTVDLHDLEFDKEFFQLMKTSPDLNELNVSYYGHDVFYYFEHIATAWQESSSRYCLTLIDRLTDTQGRIVARMRIQRCENEGSGSTLGVDEIYSTSPTAQKKVLDVPSTEIDYLDWSIDQVSAQVFGRTAMLLDMATQQHSSALKLFTLDVSQLEVHGLDSVQNVLERSRLEHLNVVCNPIDPALSQAVSQVLGAVKWDTIKSLVLSGNNVNEWLDLCPSPEAPQLLSLQICGTGLAPQAFTHSSVLFIHRLAHESMLERMDFKGVQMREASDWTVIMDAVDPAYLKSLGLCESSMNQLQLNTDATDLFDAKFNKSVGSAAHTPVPTPRTFEDMVTQRLSSPKSQSARNDAPQTSPAASERSEDAPRTLIPVLHGVQDIVARTPPATPPSTDDAVAQGPHIITQDILDFAAQTLSVTSQSADDVVVQGSHVIPQDIQDVAAQTPPSTPLSEHGVVAQGSPVVLQEVQDVVAQTPPSTPPSEHDVVVRGPYVTPKEIHDVAAQTPPSTPPSEHGVVAQGPPAIPQEVQDVGAQTLPAPPIRPHGLQEAMAQGPPSAPHGSQTIVVQGPPARPHRSQEDMVQGPPTNPQAPGQITAHGLPSRPYGAPEATPQGSTANPQGAQLEGEENIVALDNPLRRQLHKTSPHLFASLKKQ